MMDTGNNIAAKHAHPLPGYLAVTPIPASGEPAPDTGAGGVFDMLGFQIGQPGVLAGIVMEITPIPGLAEEYAPYETGATVFYWEPKAVKLGGYHYVPIQFVIAWQEEPR